MGTAQDLNSLIDPETAITVRRLRRSDQNECLTLQRNRQGHPKTYEAASPTAHNILIGACVASQTAADTTVKIRIGIHPYVESGLIHGTFAVTIETASSGYYGARPVMGIDRIRWMGTYQNIRR